uniref:Amidase domain-containing protein n=1 Tax=Panagrolaimus davidi TaxID=227884 RepID=A0A914PT44_9BILA
MGAFLKATYPFFKFLQCCFIFFNDLCFDIFNYFQERIIVPKPESDLLLISAAELAEMIRNRKISSTKVISTFIHRMKIVNPILNAVIEDNFVGALKKAEEIDEYLDKLDQSSDEFKNLSETKPFLGVPFTIKDTFYVKGFRITCGLKAFRNQIAPENAVVVKNMKDAGAIHLCITNVPEGALWVESSNMLYGRTKNPYDSRRSCGGSSGAEGAVLGAAASVISVGSDIGGSVRIPAAHNGVFSLKPSEDVVPKEGQWPKFDDGFRGKMLTAGPLCRYSKDLLPMLRIFVGNEIAEKQLQLSKPVNLNNIQFFTMEGTNSPFVFSLHQNQRNAIRKTAKHFEKKYSKPSFRIDFSKMHHASAFYWASLMYSGSSDGGTFGRLISGGNFEPSILVEVWKKIIGKSEHTIPALIMVFLEKFIHLSPENQSFYEHKREKLRAEMVALLKDDGILIYPSWPTVAPFHSSQLCLFSTFANFTGIFNFLRLPAAIVPLGLDSNGIPISVQLIAGPNNDRLLIAAAQELEAAFGGWKAPGSHLSDKTN